MMRMRSPTSAATKGSRSRVRSDPGQKAGVRDTTRAYPDGLPCAARALLSAPSASSKDRGRLERHANAAAHRIASHARKEIARDPSRLRIAHEERKLHRRSVLVKA